MKHTKLIALLLVLAGLPAIFAGCAAGTASPPADPVPQAAAPAAQPGGSCRTRRVGARRPFATPLLSLVKAQHKEQL